jgi:hypothetical protein
VAKAAAAAPGGAGMVATDVVCAAQWGEGAQRLEECGAQRRVEGDVEGAVAVFQAAATHGGADLFFEQEAVGGELESFAVIGSARVHVARLALHRKAFAVFFQDGVGLSGQLVSVGGEDSIVRSGVDVHDVLRAGRGSDELAGQPAQEEGEKEDGDEKSGHRFKALTRTMIARPMSAITIKRRPRPSSVRPRWTAVARLRSRAVWRGEGGPMIGSMRLHTSRAVT